MEHSKIDDLYSSKQLELRNYIKIQSRSYLTISLLIKIKIDKFIFIIINLISDSSSITNNSLDQLYLKTILNKKTF